MAEFLIKNFEGGEELPGDIVEVRPDGAAYGRKELMPEKFLILKVPGVDYATALQYMDALMDVTDPQNPIMIKRRKWTVAGLIPLLGSYLVTGSENEYLIPVSSTFLSNLVEKVAT